jgi:hypothetical protein
MCETKPNLGALGHLGGRTRDAGQMRQTNPIPAGTGWDRASVTRAYCAKQSQFTPRAPGNGRAAWAGRSRQGVIVQDEPNSRHSGKKDHRQGQRPWRCHPARELWRQTNPIWRRARGTGTECAKQTQFPAVARGTGILPVSLNHRQDADATVPPGGTINLWETRRQWYQTNPIPGSAGQPSFDPPAPLLLRVCCAKQTQLPEARHRGRGGLPEPPLFQYSIIPPFQSCAYRAKRGISRLGPHPVPAHPEGGHGGPPLHTSHFKLGRRPFVRGKSAFCLPPPVLSR